MNTTEVSPSEEFALASPELIASLLNQLTDQRPARRDRPMRGMPDWFDDMMSAPSVAPIGRQSRPRTVPVQNAPQQAPAPVRKADAAVTNCRRRNCGQCAQCLDNARWDRIFNEKFADPTYYGELTVRHSSTLGEVRA